MTNQTHRVLELLKRFNDGQKICIEALQDDEIWYSKSEKTIRRDLDVIKEVFPESFELLRGEGNGCYKAITKEAFENFLSKDMLSLMVRAFSIAQYNEMFSSLDLDEIDKKMIERKIKELKNIYEFKSKPFENKVESKEKYKRLENAIYHKKKLQISYKVKDTLQVLHIKPYKILFMNENFYLACEVENKPYLFSPLRISKISEIIIKKELFNHKREIDKFIMEMQTPLARYSEEYEQNLIDVRLEVNASKAEHFINKKHLKSQKIEVTKANGNLLLSFQVTQTMEMEELIKKWIPHIKVIEPIALKKKIYKEILNYLES